MNRKTCTRRRLLQGAAVTLAFGVTNARGLAGFLNSDFPAQSRGMFTGLSTGFPSLDSAIGGLLPSEVGLITAPRSVGKSSLATNIAGHVALGLKIPVLFITYDMSVEQIAIHLLCSRAQVDSQKFRDCSFDNSEWDRLETAIGDLVDGRIFITNNPFSPEKIMEFVAEKKGCRGPLLLVLDSLDGVISPGVDLQKLSRLASVLSAVKGIAKGLQVPVIVTAQSKDVLKIPKYPARKHPQGKGTDWKHMGFDWVIELQIETENRVILEVSTTKGKRTGPCSFSLDFHPQYTTFLNPTGIRPGSHKEA